MTTGNSDELFLNLVKDGTFVLTKDGNAINTKTGTCYTINKIQYHRLQFKTRNNGKTTLHTIALARLMWLVFRGPLNEFHHIRLKDSVTDYSLDNLELLDLRNRSSNIKPPKIVVEKPPKPPRPPKPPKLPKPPKPPKPPKLPKPPRQYKATNSKINEQVVADMRRTYAEKSNAETLRNLVKIYGVSKSAVRAAIIGDSWKDLTDPPPVRIVTENLIEERYPKTFASLRMLCKQPDMTESSVIRILQSRGCKLAVKVLQKNIRKEMGDIQVINKVKVMPDKQ